MDLDIDWCENPGCDELCAQFQPLWHRYRTQAKDLLHHINKKRHQLIDVLPNVFSRRSKRGWIGPGGISIGGEISKEVLELQPAKM